MLEAIMWCILKCFAIFGYPTAWLCKKFKLVRLDHEIEIWAYALLFGLVEAFVLMILGTIVWRFL